MRAPSRCPLCQNVLLHEYRSTGYVRRSCSSKLNHAFGCSSRPFEDDEIKTISVCIGNYRQIFLHWDLQEQSLKIFNGSSAQNLPYLPFDLQDPWSLINKIIKLLPFL